MPRGTLTQGRSRFHQIHGQARRLLRTLTREIRIKEAELQSLRHDEAKLAAATGQRNGRPLEGIQPQYTPERPYSSRLASCIRAIA